MTLRKHRGAAGGANRGKKGARGGRGGARGRGRGGVTTHTQHDDTDEDFARRNIESNADKYDMPEESDEESDCDESKNFEFIKTNQGGADSHFRFDDEKDWDAAEEINTNDFFSLNLNELAADMSRFSIYDVLRLDQVEAQYCVEELKQDVCTSSDVPSQSSTSEPFVWQDCESDNKPIPSSLKITKQNIESLPQLTAPKPTNDLPSTSPANDLDMDSLILSEPATDEAVLPTTEGLDLDNLLNETTGSYGNKKKENEDDIQELDAWLDDMLG